MVKKVYVRIYRGIIAAMLIILVSVIIIVLSAYYFFTHKPLPQTQGSLSVSGIEKKVTIIRDKWGVPHVFAETRKDLFFAAGYVQAQDRLFQMDFQRRAAGGRLSEWMGEEAVASDKLARQLGFYSIAQKSGDTLPRETRLCLESFAKGINRFTAYRDENLPVEYNALKDDFEPWRPEDTLAIAFYRAYCMSSNFREELLRAMLASETGSLEKYEAILPRKLLERHSELTGGPASVEELEALSNNKSFLPEKVLEFLEADRYLRKHLGLDISLKTYDSWAIGKDHTESGTPILSSTPHRGLQLPSVWYEMHLHGPKTDVGGVTLPGLPVILSGRTREFAFCGSPATVDTADLAVIELHPDDKNLYLAGERYQRFTKETRTMSVRTPSGEKRHMQIQVRQSSHGPVLESLSGPATAISLLWTASLAGDPLGPYIHIMEAENVASFQAALEKHRIPAMNFLYADNKNNLLYKMAGDVPQRTHRSGMVPTTRGKESTWQGFLKRRELPEIRESQSGILVSGSLDPRLFKKMSRTEGDAYKAYPGGRHVRLLKAPGKATLSAEDVQKLQLDVVSERARLFVPRFLSVLQSTRKNDEQMDRAWRQLEDWDGKMERDLAAPTIFAEAYWQAFKMSYEDEMSSTAFQAFASFDIAAIIFDLTAFDQDAPLFDDRGTEIKENRDDILSRALQKAIVVLSEKQGPRMSTWEWGKYHRLFLEHPLGEWPTLLKFASYFNINPDPVVLPGGRDTVNMAYYNMGESYHVRGGCSLRYMAVLDGGTPALFSYPGGQSGQPFSPHYLDMFRFWKNGKGHPLFMERSLIMENREALLDLIPERGEN